MSLGRLATRLLPVTLLPALFALGACSGGGGDGPTCVDVAGTWSFMDPNDPADDGTSVTLTKSGCDLSFTNVDTDDSDPSDPQTITLTVAGGLNGASWSANITQRVVDSAGAVQFDGPFGTLTGTFSASAGGTIDTFQGTVTPTIDVDPQDGTPDDEPFTVVGMRTDGGGGGGADCATVAEGDWEIDIVTAIGGLTLFSAPLTQSGCTVSVNSDDGQGNVVNLSGTLGPDAGGTATWNATISGMVLGEPESGNLSATFSSTGGGAYDQLAITGGTYNGEPITGGTGMRIP